MHGPPFKYHHRPIIFPAITPYVVRRTRHFFPRHIAICHLLQRYVERAPFVFFAPYDRAVMQPPGVCASRAFRNLKYQRRSGGACRKLPRIVVKNWSAGSAYGPTAHDTPGYKEASAAAHQQSTRKEVWNYGISNYAQYRTYAS